MWKTLNYHVEADLLPNGDNWARVLLPLITTLLANCTLSDHNVPSTLYPRIRDLAEASLTVLQQLEMRLTSDSVSEVVDLYYAASLGILELGQLLIAYRSFDLPGLRKFQDSLLTSLLRDNASLPWSGRKLLNHCLLTDKSQSASIIDTLGGSLNQNLDVDPLLELASAPAALFTNLELSFFNQHASLKYQENPSYAAQLVYHMTVDIESKLKRIFPDLSILTSVTISSHLWSSAEYWSSLDSELGQALQMQARQFQDWNPEIAKSHIGDILAVTSSFCRLSSLLPLEHLPKCLKLAVTNVSLILTSCVISVCPVPSALASVLARCLETTDLFRYITAGAVLVRLIKAEFETESSASVLFGSVLPVMLSRFTKTLNETADVYSDLDVRVAEPDCGRNLLFLVACLEQLPRYILESSVAQEKRDSASRLASKICKTLRRLAKSDPNLPHFDALLLRAGVALIKIYGKTAPDKISSYIKRIGAKFADIVGDPDSNELCLYNELLSLDGEDVLGIADNLKLVAWCRALHHLEVNDGALEAATALAQRVLSTASLADLELVWAEVYDFKSFAVVTLLLSVSSSVKSEEGKQLVQSSLDGLVTHLLQENLSHDKLRNLISAIVSCSTVAVTSGVEILALSAICKLGTLSSSTLSLVVTFVNHRPNIATRHIPTVANLVRRHLDCIEIAEEVEAVTMAVLLQNLFGLFGRKREDWANVAAYLLADVLNTCVALSATSQKVKQELVLACHSLLDMQLSQHSFEYLSARMPAATNEYFKVVFQNYQQHHKFTGKD
jgi:hypothetical protein